MQVIKTVKEMQALSAKLLRDRKTVGFVPTMGALHEGHVSLVRRSVEENNATVVSIFVNPTQFGEGEDLDTYPRDMEGDMKKLSGLGVDTVFAPGEDAMYPEGFSTTIDTGGMGRILCGASRPGHFNGVATVVAKLFNIVKPGRAYFGQKDFQQSVIIRKLIRDLNFDIEVITCPVVREPDGLAMSSRNSCLKHDERAAATVLYRALKRGEELILSQDEKDASAVKREMEKVVTSSPLATVDYIEIVDPDDLTAMDKVQRPAALCIAAWIGKTRLIDNIMID